jgi:hypothetical protein
MIKKKIVHPTERYSGSDAENLNIKIGLERDEQLLREGDRTIILDIAELYKKERNESTKYKIFGKTKMIFRNLYSGVTDYVPLKNSLYDLGDGLDGDWTGYLPYDEFAFIRRDTVREVATATGSTIGQFNQTISLTGTTDHTTITVLDSSTWNWNYHVSYVYDHDSTYPMKYTLSGNTTYDFTAESGVPFRVEVFDTSYQLISPIKHNMSLGEHIVLSGTTLTNVNKSDRVFNITSVGDNNYESELYVINISKSEFTTSQITIMDSIGVVFGQRCLDRTNIIQTTSKYYVHKHKTITTVDDCIIDNCGFETPIFEIERKLQFETADQRNDVYIEQNRPESVLYHFKNAIDIKGLRNNLNYTPTEVYLTTTFRNRNGYFNYPPRNGWKFNFHNSWVDEQFDDSFSGSDTNLPFTSVSSSGFTFKQGDELPVGTVLDGAFVEYNEQDFKETILSEGFHKISSDVLIFNHGQSSLKGTFAGLSQTNPSGLIYQPHHRIKLRELSPYVETANTNNIHNLPENVIYDELNGVWKWRDLYDHGYVDPDNFGTNHPFTNGQHYVHSDINFLFRNEERFLNKGVGIKNFTSDDDNC